MTPREIFEDVAVGIALIAVVLADLAFILNSITILKVLAVTSLFVIIACIVATKWWIKLTA